MRVASARLSFTLSEFPNSSSIFRLTEPEPFFSTWRNCSFSPWRSDTKCSVPLGRFKIEDRLMISVDAFAMLGNCLASWARYFFSITSPCWVYPQSILMTQIRENMPHRRRTLCRGAFDRIWLMGICSISVVFIY